MCLYTALKLQEYIFLWTWKLGSDGKGSIFSQWKLDGCSIILARKIHWVVFLFITTAALVMILSFLKQADCHFLLGSYLTVQFHLSHKWHDGLWWMVSDSWSPKERILLWHQRGSFSHSELREVNYLLQWKRLEKSSDLDTRSRSQWGRECPTHLSYQSFMYFFNWLLIVDRFSQTHSHNIHLPITGLVRSFLLEKRNMSSGKTRCYYIIIRLLP